MIQLKQLQINVTCNLTLYAEKPLSFLFHSKDKKNLLKLRMSLRAIQSYRLTFPVTYEIVEKELPLL